MTTRLPWARNPSAISNARVACGVKQLMATISVSAE
jgi:hypothetical protein